MKYTVSDVSGSPVVVLIVLELDLHLLDKITRRSDHYEHAAKMLCADFADPPAIEGSEWLRIVAEGKMPPDPLGDLAVDIVEELEREIVSRETAWHDISLHETVSEIIRRHLRKALT